MAELQKYLNKWNITVMIWAFLSHRPKPWLSHFITSIDLQLKFAGSIVSSTMNKGVFWLGTEVKDTELETKKNIGIKMKIEVAVVVHIFITYCIH